MGLANQNAMDFRGMELRQKLPTVYPDEATTTVTQATNRSTGVTLNATAGQITTDTTVLNAGQEVQFTVTNSYVTAKTVPVIAIASGATVELACSVTAVSAGSFEITYTNLSGGSESGALVINFALIDVN